MKIPVECSPGHTELAEFDLDFLSSISVAPDFSQELTDAFRLECRVPDVWRYNVKMHEGSSGPLTEIEGRLPQSQFSDRLATDASGAKIILLVLESPHTDEYSFVGETRKLAPIAPAQGTGSGKAGGGIREHLRLVLDQLGLPNDDYLLLIVNPIQYHCSLSHLRTVPRPFKKGKSKRPGIIGMDTGVRDNVWSVLWNLGPMQDYFDERCQRYNPHTVLNCCTTKLELVVTKFLWQKGFRKSLFVTSHPAITWNVNHKEKAELPGIKVYRIIDSDGDRTLLHP